MARWVKQWAAAVLAIGVVAGMMSGTGAQNDVENTISLLVSNCPPGMSADTLVEEDCTPVTEGLDVQIESLSGIMAPLTLSDATLVGETFVWENVVIDDRGAFGPLSISETVIPDGYSEYVVEGTGVEPNSLGDWTFRVSPQYPNPVLNIYNFGAVESTPEPEPAGYVAVIGTGTCDDSELTTVTPLTAPAIPSGVYEGATGALLVATSYSIVDISLTALLESDHRIVILESNGTIGEGEVAGCGVIGGVRTSDGAIAVGILARHQTGVAGVAYFAQLLSDPDQTQVSLFVIWSGDDD